MAGASRRAIPPGPRRPVWPGRAATGLCLLGLGVSAYLTAAHYTSASILACSDRGFVNCGLVTTSPESVIAGVPVAVLGLVYFLGMGALNLPAAWRRGGRWATRARLAGALAGVGMVLYLVYTELFTLGAICLYCTSVHVITVVLFAVIVLGTATGAAATG